MPEIIIISALTYKNRVIGKNGKLPWPTIPEDAQRFRDLTIGHAVIMGRKTWEFDVEKRPLSERYNVVIANSIPANETDTFQAKYPSSLTFVNSLPDALLQVESYEKVFIVGGASIYSQSLSLANTWELTIIEQEYEGDTFFPEYKFLIGQQFELTNLEARTGYRFETYKNTHLFRLWCSSLIGFV
jgi:dihydrofolate reductase